MWFLGIDIGTTHVKVVGVTEDGHVLDAGKRRTPTVRLDGLIHHDAAEIWQTAVDLIGEYAKHTAAEHGRLGAISIGSFGQEESVILDAGGQVVRPSQGWWQIRDELSLDPAVAEYFDSYEHYQVSGFRHRPIQSPEQIARVRRHHPADWARVAGWADFTSYAGWRLTGEWATSTSQINHSQVFDYTSLRPHAESLDALGVEATLFPPVVHPGVHIGQVAPAALPGVDLVPGAPVVMGGHDQVLAAYAVSQQIPVTAFDSIGTSEYAMIVGARPEPTPEGYARGIDIEPSWRQGDYLLGCATPSGKVLDLLARLFFRGDFDRLFAVLDAEPVTGSGPEVTISTMGADDTGLLSLHGIPPEADPASVARVCVDTLADRVADGMRLMRRLSGGSDGDIALMGSLFHRPQMVEHRRRRWPESLLVSQIAEPVATGAALLAREATKEEP